MLVTGTNAGRRAFYHANWEHSISDSNAEVRDASGVEIYGLKSEGQYAVLWVRNSTGVLLSSYGGNACPFAASAWRPVPFCHASSADSHKYWRSSSHGGYQ
jgi:hypothetical protein